MGLDMFLWKMKKQKGKTFDEVMEIKRKLDNEEIKGVEKENLKMYMFHTKLENINYEYDSLFKEVYYWRKANAIHQWFVDNIQNGNDDCEDYRVTQKDLQILIDTLRDVYNSLCNKEMITKKVQDGSIEYEIKVFKEEDLEIAKQLLPTQEGFFFGGTQYDEYYFEDIKKTLNDLQIINECFDFENNYLIYGSSW